MDNVTHTLVGLLVGETAAQPARAVKGGLSAETRRALIVWIMAIGSNLPDADLLYTGLTGGKLGYLLHHRGYTHTVVGALLAAVLMLGACEVWLRRRRLVPSRAERLWLLGAALTGPLLHLAMDFTNSYGVHPFWPFYDGWLYGDSVFIVEPIMWAAAAPLVFQLRTAVARALVAIALALGVLLAFLTGLVPSPLPLALAALVAGMLLIGYLAPPPAALAAGTAVWLGITGVFIVAGRVAAHEVEAYTRTHFPGTVMLDHVLTPMPSDPLCWEALLLGLEGDTYVARRAMLSLAPGVLKVARCGSRSLQAPTTAPLHPVADRGSEALAWYGEFTMPGDLYRAVVASSCEAAAFARFARAPWVAGESAERALGDLRFDRQRASGFAELRVSGTEDCPSFVPPWLPPRADLLTPSP